MYIDDCIIVRNFLHLIINVKLLFHCEPKMSNDEEITYLLSMQILCDHVVGWLCTCLKKNFLSMFYIANHVHVSSH